jgi:hypothetical protein
MGGSVNIAEHSPAQGIPSMCAFFSRHPVLPVVQAPAPPVAPVQYCVCTAVFQCWS